MAMNINRSERADTPFDILVKGLSAAKSAFGIPVDIAQISELSQKSGLESLQKKQLETQADPKSQASKLAQGETNLALNYAVKHGYTTDAEVSPIRNMVLGKDPEGKEVGPGLSAGELGKNPEISPFYTLIKGQQQADAAKTRLEGLTDTRKDANLQRANAAYDSNISKRYEDRLDAANRVKVLISKAMKGDLIPSETLGQQLATDINVLQTPTGRATVSGTEHSRPNTLFGKGGTLVHLVTGDPQAAITQGDLGQMLKETDFLYKEIGDQHKSKFASWIKGQPEKIRPALIDRFTQSRSEYFAPETPGTREPAASGGGLPGISDANAGDTIEVISPEGVHGQIPRSNLEAAQKRGFKAK